MEQMDILDNNKDVCDYAMSLGLEVGSVFFQRFPDRTRLVVELVGRVTMKQLRKIEIETGTTFDNMELHYNPINGSHVVDLVFLR